MPVQLETFTRFLNFLLFNGVLHSSSLQMPTMPHVASYQVCKTEESLTLPQKPLLLA